MRYFKVFIYAILLSLFSGFAFSESALLDLEKPVSVTVLIENSKDLDNKNLRFQGEAIGEVFNRGDFIWINLSDGTGAMGIWVKKEQVPKDLQMGSWKMKGSILSVSGVFHRACPEHGGDMDIHAQSISLISSGFEVYHNVSFLKILIALFLVILAIFTVILYRRLYLVKRGK